MPSPRACFEDEEDIVALMTSSNSDVPCGTTSTSCGRLLLRVRNLQPVKGVVLAASLFAAVVLLRWSGREHTSSTADREVSDVMDVMSAADERYCPECSEPCSNRDGCLSIVDHYFMDAGRAPLGLFQTYGRDLYGGNCSLCDLTEDRQALSQRCDVYDNAVAAIYFTKRGNLEEARKTLQVFEQLLYPADPASLYPEELFTGLPSGRSLTLLAAAYNCQREIGSQDYSQKVAVDENVDTGNNAWVALAFVHYAAATGSGSHSAVAADIMKAINLAARCDDSLRGYLARLPPKRGNQRSIEHNIDITALAGMLGDSASEDHARKFVRQMYGRNKAFPTGYSMGTGTWWRCDQSQPMGAPVAADGHFWNILAEADRDAANLGSAVSLALFDEGFWAEDLDFIFDHKPHPRLYGVKFTTRGSGVQWEETAGAAMALSQYLHHHAEGADSKFMEQLQSKLSRSRESLRKLLTMYGGVPASVRGGSSSAYHQANQAYPGGTDTGMGFSYLRMFHTASTAWTGLLMLYQTEDSDPVNEAANPLQLVGATLPVPDPTFLPQQDTSPRAATADLGSCDR